MAVATISVNFANLADVQAGATPVQSISPLILRNALTSGTGLYNLNVNGATFNNTVSIASGNLTVAGNIVVSSTGSSFNGITSTAGLNISSGLATIAAGLTVSAGNVLIQSTTPTSSYTTGALVVAGGVGIGGDVRIGNNGDLIVESGGIIQSADFGILKNMATFAAPRLQNGSGQRLFRPAYNIELLTNMQGIPTGTTILINGTANAMLAGTSIPANAEVTMNVTLAPTNVCMFFGYKYT